MINILRNYKGIMNINLKICNNSSCWEAIWAFPKKVCPFCWSKDYDEFKIKFWLVLWWTTAYEDKDKQMWVLKNYKGCDHLFIREKIWEWNDCDNNGWYTHIPCIDDVREIEKLINTRISKQWDYLIIK